MPKTTAISADLRTKIGNEIAIGLGRNELARRHNVSPGLVSKIARERNLYFQNCANTAAATYAHQVDMWALRVDREDEILTQYLTLNTTMKPNGEPTREAKRLSYALYNVNRHSKHGQRSP